MRHPAGLHEHLLRRNPLPGDRQLLRCLPGYLLLGPGSLQFREETIQGLA